MSSRAQQLQAEEEHFAKQDDIRERYASESRDLRVNDLIEQEHTEYMTKVWDAGYGTDHEAYEACWTRTLQYYESQTD